MATLITRTIKGSGLGGDYTTLAGAESGEQAARTDLVTRDEQLTIECFASAAPDTTRVDVDGFTTDATRYIVITSPTAERHTGKWDTTKYRLAPTASGNFALAIYEPYTRLVGIQVYNQTTDGFSYAAHFDVAGPLYVSHCIFRVNAAIGSGSQRVLNIRANPAYFWNCVAWGARSPDGLSRGFNDNLNAGPAYIYNCTAYDCDDGFFEGDNGWDFIVKNCLAANCTRAFPAGWNWPAACDYNATNNALAAVGSGAMNNPPGANRRVSQTFSFVDAANGDFHLQASDTGALGFGADLSADSNLAFSDDIDGQTRTGTWDIGADEYVAAGADTTLAAALSGTASLAAALTTQIQMAAALSGTGTLAGALTTQIQMAAQLNATGALLAALSTEIRLAAAISGSGTLAGSLQTDIRLAAALQGLGSLTAALTTQIQMAAALAGSGTLAADLDAGNGSLSAVLAGTAQLAAALSTQITLAAQLAGSGAVAAALTTEIRMAAQLATSGALAGDLQTDIQLAAALAGSSSLAAALTTAIELQALLQGSGSLTADLLVAEIIAVLNRIAVTLHVGQDIPRGLHVAAQVHRDTTI